MTTLCKGRSSMLWLFAIVSPTALALDQGQRQPIGRVETIRADSGAGSRTVIEKTWRPQDGGSCKASPSGPHKPAITRAAEG